MVPIHGWFYLTSIDQSSYLSPLSKYLTSNFNNLELGQFKVIQGQTSWCQLIAHALLWPLLSPASYLSPFSRHLTLNIFSIGAMITINSSSSSEDRNVSDFQVTTSPGTLTLVVSLVNIGGRFRSVKHSSRFVRQTHSITHWHTHKLPL